MTELIIYSILLIALLAHLGMAMALYVKINRSKALSFHEKNNWRLKALLLPVYYWFAFRNHHR
jgi:hypothetical protein